MPSDESFAAAHAPAAILENALLFVDLLRRAGIAVSTGQSQSFVIGLELIEVGVRDQFYYTARALLVNRYEDLRLFDQLFALFWRKPPPNSPARRQPMPIAPRHNLKPQQFNIATYMAYKARAFDQELDIVDKSNTYSSSELLQRKEFAQMTPEELLTVKELMLQLRWSVSQRVSRRRKADQRGDLLNMRQLLRNAVKHGGIPIRLAWQRRKIKQRPIVLIADISGSMEKYARLLLQFFYSVSHSLGHVECFVFGSRLTRITPQLKVKNIDRAVSEASREVVDWAGGTRIGASLQRFNRQWSRRMLRRGALVVLVSDGWERGDVQELRREMRYLQHRCHRLIWLNPLSGRESYQPLVEGMAAALPFVDDFLPIHNLQSLEQLAAKLATLEL